MLILAHPVYPISTLNINNSPLSWYHHPSFSPRQKKTIPSSSSHASPSLFPQQRKRSLASSSEMRISAFDVPISPFPLPLLSRFLISPIQFRKSTHAPPPPPLPPPPPHSLAFIDPRKGEKIFFPPPFLQDWCQEKMTSKTNRGIRTLTPMRKFSISHKNRYRSTMQRLCFAFFCICLCIVCMSHNIWSQTRRTKRRKEFLADFGSSIHPRRPLRHPTHPPPPPPPNNQPFRCHSHILFKSFHFPSIPTGENSSFVNYHHAPSTTFPFLFPLLPITPPTFSSFFLDVRDLTPK